jgi:hypothetical protein
MVGPLEGGQPLAERDCHRIIDLLGRQGLGNIGCLSTGLAGGESLATPGSHHLV